MAKLLEKELERLKKLTFELCAMVEENFKKAVRSIADRDVRYANTVINNDDEIDTKEIEVEEECLKILALHQPVASDLRFIVSVIKINNDLERIGDLAVNVAKRAIQLLQHDKTELQFDFNDMFVKSITMLKRSLDCFINFNSSLAFQVIKDDDEIDRLNKQLFLVVKDAINRHPEHIDIMFQYLSISRCLERIADHATIIAEDVIYMVEGTIVRHKKRKQ